MEQFFTKDYTGEPFILFNTPHLVGLGIVLLVVLSMFLVKRSQSPRLRNAVRCSLAGTLLVVEISWHLWNYFTGQWTLDKMLPLHLCSIMVWLSIYMLLTKNYSIFEFAYLLGIAGALQALLTPDAGRYGFPHFRFFQVMMSHGALVTAAVYMAVVEGYRPYPKSLVRVLVGANIYMAFVGLVNWLVGGNYMFIAHKPETASLLDVLPPWPWYIGIIEILGLVFILLFYAPYGLKDWKGRRRPVIQESSVS